jgi:hypothetical protein
VCILATIGEISHYRSLGLGVGLSCVSGFGVDFKVGDGFAVFELVFEFGPLRFAFAFALLFALAFALELPLGLA